MTNRPMGMGHRIQDISWNKGYVSCACGSEFKLDEGFDRETVHDALRDLFREHRLNVAHTVGVKVH